MPLSAKPTPSRGNKVIEIIRSRNWGSAYHLHLQEVIATASKIDGSSERLDRPVKVQLLDGYPLTQNDLHARLTFSMPSLVAARSSLWLVSASWVLS